MIQLFRLLLCNEVSKNCAAAVQLRSIIAVCETRGPLWIRRMSSHSRAPENAIEHLIRTSVCFTEWKPRRDVCIFAQARVGNLFRGRIHLIDRNVVEDRVEGSEIRHVCETVKHRRLRAHPFDSSAAVQESAQSSDWRRKTRLMTGRIEGLFPLVRRFVTSEKALAIWMFLAWVAAGCR